MALFGNERDVSLFRVINRELIHDIIDITVLIYRIDPDKSVSNIYEETVNKIYLEPIEVHSLITIEQQQFQNTENGIDKTQPATFAFLRDDLVDIGVPIQAGDIIEFRSSYFEIDSVIEPQNFMGKNPDNWFGGTSHGWNISIICQGHMTNQAPVQLSKVRLGNSETIKSQTLPRNL